jgi:hypothetical protein
VPEPAPRRFGSRLLKLPTERDWERSALLEPLLTPRDPGFVSDGGGLPFSPAALDAPAAPLDPGDPAVEALIGQIARSTAPKRGGRMPWKRGTAAPAAPAAPAAAPSLQGWRELARTDDEALFARGRPPQLLTVAVRLDRRGREWECVDVGAARPLRATRDRIRASRWRIDPTHELEPAETVLRLLVTEQTFAGAQRASGRVLAPDLHAAEDELVLTMFVTPRPGFQARTPNPETPVRIALPDPIGSRRLIDGALYSAHRVDAPGDA